jgi:hypothetical protein
LRARARWAYEFQQAHDVLDGYVRLGLRELSEFDVDDFIRASRKTVATPSTNGENEATETLSKLAAPRPD